MTDHSGYCGYILINRPNNWLTIETLLTWQISTLLCSAAAVGGNMFTSPDVMSCICLKSLNLHFLPTCFFFLSSPQMKHKSQKTFFFLPGAWSLRSVEHTKADKNHRSLDVFFCCCFFFNVLDFWLEAATSLSPVIILQGCHATEEGLEHFH